LQTNLKLNKVQQRVQSFCLDGRAFIRALCATPEAAPAAASPLRDGQAAARPAAHQSARIDKAAAPLAASDSAASVSRAGDSTSAHGAVQSRGSQYSEAQGGLRPPDGVLWNHSIMNLPGAAVEFCDAYRGAFNQRVWRGRLPMVHCYTFQKRETEAGAV
jgi:tRNA (guanine37-N1)-methyltransferase